MNTPDGDASPLPHAPSLAEMEPSPPPPPPEERALRVSQLDADELDNGLVSMLVGKLSGALSAFSPSAESTFNPEINLLFKLLLYALAIRNRTNRTTPGLSMQNLKYSLVSSRRNLTHIQIYNSLLLLPLLSTLPTYLLDRLHSHSLQASYPEYPRNSWQRRWWVLLERLKVVERGVEVVGFLGLLVDGRYPTISARLAGVRLIPSQPLGSITRQISYEFMNRQLAWTGFTELLIFLLPLLRSHSSPMLALISSIRSFTYRTISFLRSSHQVEQYAPIALKASPSGRGGTRGQDGEKSKRRRGVYWDLPKRTCAICHHKFRNTLDTQLGLPPISTTTHATDAVLDEDDQAPAGNAGRRDDNEETRIHLPTRAGCEEGCMYCYHCIAEALGRARKEDEAKGRLRLTEAGQQKPSKAGKGEGRGEDKGKGWTCLRCEEDVWECNRIT